MKIEQTTLENGLNTLFIDSPGSSLSSLQIWFKAGSSLENKENQGIAHFLEHMFFKGTKKYPGAMIARTVESFGGELNAFTSFDYTCYYINAPSNHTLESIDVLMDMVSNPLFLQEDLEPERDVVFEEYRRSIDNSSQYNFFQIQENTFPKAYSHPILGNEKTITNFSREQLIEFRNKYYNNQNAIFVVSGDLKKKDKILDLLNNYTLPNGSISSFPKFKLKNDSDIAIHHKPVNQAAISLTIQAPEQIDDNSPVEDLALNCLAFGDISPLYKGLVSETSLANGVSGSTMFFSKGGVHFLKLACPIENVNKAITKLKQTIIESLKAGFSTSEIDRIKNQYIASKVYEKETIESFAFTLGNSFAQGGNIYSEDEFINKMKHVSSKQVNKSLIDIFSREIHINVQLPEEENVSNLGESLFKFREAINKEAKKVKDKKPKYKMKSSEYDSEVKEIELAKNITLIYRRNLMTPTFVLHSYLKGGIAHENSKNNGIYNLIARNITYGYKGISYEKLKTKLEQSSSYLNGFSGKNAYGTTLHGLSEHSKDLFGHFFNILLEPAFPAKYFETEKKLLKRTIHLQKEDPIKHCFKRFNSLIFNKHPYALDLIGNETTLKSLKRKNIVDKHNEALTKSKIVLTYCGDMDLDSLLELMSPYTDKLKARPNQAVIKNNVQPIEGHIEHITFDREQTHIVIGRSGYKVSSNEDLYLKLFTTYLSGQSSELFTEVRDRQGLCYAVQTLHHTALEAGYWGIYIGAGHDKVQAAIKAIKDIIQKYQKKGLSKSEFNRVKKMINGQNLIGIQTNDDYANFYSIATLHNLGLDYQHKTFKRLNDMNVDSFNKFLKKFLNYDWNEITVGRD